MILLSMEKHMVVPFQVELLSFHVKKTWETESPCAPFVGMSRHLNIHSPHVTGKLSVSVHSQSLQLSQHFWCIIRSNYKSVTPSNHIHTKDTHRGMSLYYTVTQLHGSHRFTHYDRDPDWSTVVPCHRPVTGSIVFLVSFSLSFIHVIWRPSVS